MTISDFEKAIGKSENTLIAYLKTTYSKNIEDIVSQYRTIHINPIGGWDEWNYGHSYPWSRYLHTRKLITPEFQESIIKKNWCEVGFSPLPFLQFAPSSWNYIGILQHPLSWIKTAFKEKWHTQAGDGVDWTVETYNDYARLWLLFTDIILSKCHLFRIEDITGEFPEIIFDDESVWEIVADKAQKLGYQRSGDRGILSKWESIIDKTQILGYQQSGYERILSDIRINSQENSISVIIASRNNGAYLHDTFHSAINQSLVPCEIIYIDDGSTDNSLEIAQQYPQVKIIAKEHTGVCESRNLGCKIAKGKYLLHLDGDDIFPYPYLEKRLNKLQKNPEATFCYGPAQAFGGGFNQFWEAPEWDQQKIWISNFCNTSTLIKTKEFLEIGGWREGIGTAWDWDLFLRFNQAGYTGIYDPETFLLYRHHPQSISYLQDLKLENDEAILRMKYLERNLICKTLIASILSGRLLKLFPEWLESLIKNIEYFNEQLLSIKPFQYFGQVVPNKPDLTLLVTGSKNDREYINRYLDKYLDVFDNITVISEPWNNIYSTEEERGNNLSKFLAKKYNQLLNTNCEIVWFVEDDIIPPINAMTDLNKALMNTITPLYATAGIYRNRHDPEYLIAHNWPDIEDITTIVNYRDLPTENTFMDMTGTGCLMIFRPFANQRFEPHVMQIPAHDWNWCLKLKELSISSPNQVLLLKDVVCRHYQSMDTYI